MEPVDDGIGIVAEPHQCAAEHRAGAAATAVTVDDDAFARGPPVGHERRRGDDAGLVAFGIGRSRPDDEVGETNACEVSGRGSYFAASPVRSTTCRTPRAASASQAPWRG